MYDARLTFLKCLSIAIAIAIGLSIAAGSARRALAATDDQFEMGARHYSAGRWLLAIAEFRDYLEQSPDGEYAADARFYLAECLVQLGSYTESEQAFTAFLEKHPQHSLVSYATFRLGETAYLQEHYDDAHEYLERFSKETGNNTVRDEEAQSGQPAMLATRATALMYLADIAVKQKEYSHAASLYEQALELNPTAETADRCHFRLADVQSQLRELAKAEIHWQLVAESTSTLADDSCLRLCTMYIRQERFEDALEIISKISDDRDDLSVHVAYWKGRALGGLDQHAEAAELWESTAIAYPQRSLAPRMLYEAANEWRAAKQHDRAEAAWNRVVQLWPSSEWSDDALAELTEILLDEQRWTDVVTNWKRLRTQYPNSSRLADVDRRTAAELLEKGKYESVEAVLNQQNVGKTNDQDTLYYLAIAELGTQRFLQALNHLMMLEAKSLSAERREDVLAARVAAHNGLLQPSEVVRLAQSYLDSYPAGRHRLTCESQMIRALVDQNNLGEARRALQQRLNSRPEHSDTTALCLQLAQAEQRAGDDENALATYCELLKLPPGTYTVNAEFAAARLLEKLQRPEEATQLLEKIANQNPEFVDHDTVLYLWAWMLVDLHRGDQADQVFQRLYAAHPQSQYWPDATYRLAERAARVGDHILSGQLLNQLIAEPRSANVRAHALYLKGQIAAEKKAWPEAVQAMQQLLDEYADTPLRLHAEFWLAESAYRQAHHDEAEERFARLAEQTASSNEPWVATIALRQAQQLARKQQWEEALEITEGIAKRFPEFTQQYEVDYLCGRCLMGQGRFEEARSAFQNVLKSSQPAGETAAMAQWMIGESYMHQKRFDDALRAYHRVELRYKFPRWQSAGALQIGKCHEARGDTKEAANAYRRAAEQYGNSSFANEARRRLNEFGQASTKATARSR